MSYDLRVFMSLRIRASETENISRCSNSALKLLIEKLTLEIISLIVINATLRVKLLNKKQTFFHVVFCLIKLLFLALHTL